MTTPPSPVNTQALEIEIRNSLQRALDLSRELDLDLLRKLDLMHGILKAFRALPTQATETTEPIE